MQNKHSLKCKINIIFFGVPTFGEGGGGGVKPVGTKSQVYPKKSLDGSPKLLSTVNVRSVREVMMDNNLDMQ